MNRVKALHPFLNQALQLHRLEQVNLTKLLTWCRHALNGVGAVAVLVALAIAVNPTWRQALADGLAPDEAVELADNTAVMSDSIASTTITNTGDTTANASALDKSPSQLVAVKTSKHLTVTQEQAKIAKFIAQKYHVATAATSQLVAAAYATGKEAGLDPLLILGVMAVESSFNPYAESGVGAQGLMQVMTSVHKEKYALFGGSDSAFNPITNIKVGAMVLKDCIRKGGSIPAGLRLYVGSTSTGDGGYGARVLAERDRLQSVVRGRAVSPSTAQAVTTIQTSVNVKTKAAAVTLPNVNVSNTSNGLNTSSSSALTESSTPINNPT